MTSKARGNLQNMSSERQSQVLEKAASNPHGVKVGQVWKDTDPRMSRHLKVIEVAGAYATVAQCDDRGRVLRFSTARLGGRTSLGKRKERQIRLDRFKAGSSGFVLVSKGPA